MHTSTKLGVFVEGVFPPVKRCSNIVRRVDLQVKGFVERANVEMVSEALPVSTVRWG